MRSKYDIPDPWPTRIREAIGRLLCRLFGHPSWNRKMYGEICTRCRTFRPD